MTSFALPRNHKLKSRSAIDTLFRDGTRFSVFPVLTWHRWVESEHVGLQVGFSCSKKHFKRAVDRNRIKRLMREGYRLQQGPLREAVAAKGLEGQVFFIFLDKTLPDFATIHAAIGKSLQKLQRKLDESPD